MKQFFATTIDRNSRAVAFAACLVMPWLVTSVPAQELLGYWQFEETSVDDDALDSSGNGNHGIYEGEIDPDVDGAPGFGSGVYLDGFDAQILIGPGDETGFGELTSDFSVMAWMAPDQFESKNRVFGSAPWEANSGWGWGTNGDQLEITTWGVKDYDQAVPLELDEWVHAAIVLDDDFSAHFYVDGEFVGTQEHPAEGGPTINDFYIGYAAVAAEHFSGMLDEVAVFDGTLSEEQIRNAMTLGASNFNGGEPCDFDGDGELGIGDLDMLLEEIKAGTNNSKFDVNGDGSVNKADNDFFVTDASKLNSYIGDSNLDGEFSSADFVLVFTANEYEDAVPLNSTWGEGDWNADGDFDSSDFVAAFTEGGYEKGPKPAAVPEPAAAVLLFIGSLAVAALRRRV